MTAEQRQQYRDAARAAQNSVALGREIEDIAELKVLPRVVLELLDFLDKLEADVVPVLENLQAEVARMRPAYELVELIKARDTIDKILGTKQPGTK